MSNPGAFNPLTIDAAAHASALSTAPASSSQTGIVLHTTTTREAQLSDAVNYVRFTNAGAVTYTIPANAVVPFPINTVIEFEQAGAGAVTVAPDANVTINCRGADFTLAGQYAVAALRKVDTDIWVLTGDL